MIVPVVLAGGVGSRLWPLSRRSTPKQLHILTGDKSLLQATVARTGDPERCLVICGLDVVDEVTDQLQGPAFDFVVEPEGRNTAPAIMAAAALVEPDDVLVVLPADHVIVREEVFGEKLETAIGMAQEGHVVTFGVMPRRPETGYGYIRSGDRIGEGWAVERFVEKPNAKNAARMVSSGRYLWNSGMFVARASVITEETSKHAPELFESVEGAVSGAVSDDNRIKLSEEFLNAPQASFDTAIMENTMKGVVIPIDVGWSDVGSWAALWELESNHPEDNVLIGDVVSRDTTGSYVRSESRLVATVGVEDVVVVETADAVLVVSRDQADVVKELVEELNDRPETR